MGVKIYNHLQPADGRDTTCHNSRYAATLCSAWKIVRCPCSRSPSWLLAGLCESCSGRTATSAALLHLTRDTHNIRDGCDAKVIHMLRLEMCEMHADAPLGVRHGELVQDHDGAKSRELAACASPQIAWTAEVQIPDGSPGVDLVHVAHVQNDSLGRLASRSV